MLIDFKKSWVFLLMIFLMSFDQASAEYNRRSDSRIDLNTFKIDERTYLGTKLNGELLLLDENGSEFRLKEKFGVPMVLVLSYYRCDGVCPTINTDLKDILSGANRMRIGENYNVLTVSFDKHESPMTIKMFKKELELSPEMAKGWTVSRFKNPEKIKEFTNSIGYKYFWSTHDRTFFHPNVYVLVSPEGRVTRFLYATTMNNFDVELALMEAGKEQIKPNEAINFLISACFSYNYKEGKYSYNYPLFIAVGSLLLGIVAFAIGSTVIYKKKYRFNHREEVS